MIAQAPPSEQISPLSLPAAPIPASSPDTSVDHVPGTAGQANGFLTSRWFFVLLGSLLILGMALRIYPSTGFRGTGFDERLYIYYVQLTHKSGLLSYPDIVDKYIEGATKLAWISAADPLWLYPLFLCVE